MAKSHDSGSRWKLTPGEQADAAGGGASDSRTAGRKAGKAASKHSATMPAHVFMEEDDEEHISFGEFRRTQEADMDMTPMVDVTFLLLIFFMVTAAFSLQKSLRVPTPKPEQPSTAAVPQDPEEDPSTVTVRVDEYSTFQVVTIDWEIEAASEAQLLIKLREARQGDTQGRVPTKLMVMAHVEALYERVVTALDAGTEVGFDEVQLATIEDL